MSFFRRIGRRFTAWMSGRNGIDQLAFVSLTTSLILQLMGSVTGFGLLVLVSIVLYAWALFRVFSKKSYKREEENKKFVLGWESARSKAHQFFLRLKLRRQYKYFKCPQCKTLLRSNRGEGEKDIRCPKCQHYFKIKT
ncbi:MAG: hypothetical protein IKH30_09795 [Clostridia bacterium]|nr:hypothetical protein [Clostridia bacterium]